MCVTSKRPLKIRVAKRDIHVYKVLYDKNLKSPFYPTEYKLNVRNYSKLDISYFVVQNDVVYLSTTGLYSYIRKKDAEDMCSLLGYDAFVYEAVIPSGSLYIKDSDEMVSDTIIIKNKL